MGVRNCRRTAQDRQYNFSATHGLDGPDVEFRVFSVSVPRNIRVSGHQLGLRKRES